MSKISLVLLLLTTFALVSSLDKNEWKQKVIYQVITDRFWRTDGSTKECLDLGKYCGGTWKGLTEKIDYIKNMGFDAIWISPILKNLPESYHGYSIIDLYSLNDVFGTQAEYDALVAACHQRGIALMVDVVPNHMASVMFDYSSLIPFNKPEHFHDYCYIQNHDYQHNQWRITNCRLLNLPDLKQENPYVKKTLLEWITNFVKKYKIDGLRLDAVPHMPHWFIKEFNKAASADGDMFMIGECFDPRFDFVGSYQADIDGLFNFPMFFTANDVYKSGKSPQLISDLWKQLNKLPDVDALGLFLDNHDTSRFLNGLKKEEYFRLNNALTFIFFSRGIPVVYYGTEQGFADGTNPNPDPANRAPLWTTHLNEDVPFYKYIAMLIKIRKDNKIPTLKFLENTVSDQVYAFQRGDVLIVTVNQAVNGVVDIDVDYDDDTQFCSAFDAARCYTVKTKKIGVLITNSMPEILVKK